MKISGLNSKLRESLPPKEEDEEAQWQAVTLGQLSAVTRQYATEVTPECFLFESRFSI